MRTLSALLTLAAALALLATPRAANLMADEQDGQVVVIERIQDLQLTDAQETKIADIRNEYKPKVQAAAKELAGIVKEEVEKVRQVLTPEQREKLQTLREERRENRIEGLSQGIARLKDLDLTDDETTKIQEIRKDFRPRIVAALEGMKGILSEGQKQAREQGLQAGKKRLEILASLNLTDEQKEKMTAACKSVGTAVNDELAKIREVLNPAQQGKLVDLKDEVREHIRDRMAARVANLKDLNLTAEQKSQIETIRNEYRPRVHEAGNRLRAAVREEMQMILAVLKG